MAKCCKKKLVFYSDVSDNELSPNSITKISKRCVIIALKDDSDSDDDVAPQRLFNPANICKN